jgi:cytochrome b
MVSTPRSPGGALAGLPDKTALSPTWTPPCGRFFLAGAAVRPVTPKELQMSASLPATPSGQPVKVWDGFIRLFHWSMVAIVALNLFILEEGDVAHRWLGYVAAGGVLARLVWGFVGSRYARFSDWFPTPARLRAHLSALRRGEPETHLGHNPLAGLMIMTLLSLLLALALSGWLMGTDAYFGVEWVEELHEGLANGLQGLVVLHVLAAVLMGRKLRQPLIQAMVTGYKKG